MVKPEPEEVPKNLQKILEEGYLQLPGVTKEWELFCGYEIYYLDKKRLVYDRETDQIQTVYNV